MNIRYEVKPNNYIGVGLLSFLMMVSMLFVIPSGTLAGSTGSSANSASTASVASAASAVSTGSSAVSSPDVSQSVSVASDSPDITDTPVNPILRYEIDIKTESALVVETGRGMQLYIKNPGIASQIPIASKLMTALLAVESIPSDTMITISNVAAGQADSYVLSLKTGEKYSIEYLLHGLILKDNNAAAVALAEQVSGTLEEFVVLMNARAASYQMTDTVFTNATGIPDSKQVTTVSDISRLFRFAMAFTRFENIFKTHDSVFILSSKLTKHLISNAADMWSISEGTTGVFKSETKSKSSYAVTAKSGQISIFIIGTSSVNKEVVADVSAITQSIFRDYEYSRLISEGQIFPQKMTVEGRTFNMKFLSDVSYVHPKSLDFIHDTLYEPQENVILPVITTKAVAKVTFILLDGTSISAELFPTEDIWGDSGIYRRLLDIYAANKDVGNLILIAVASFLMIAMIRIVMLLVKVIARGMSRSGRRR
ncbi:MAG: D-alanyl-D-alanine carboxypeptidase family protein [Saccharofermentanales bacterium]